MIDIRASEAGHSPITIEAVYPTSAERLFRAWTSAEDLRRWFGQNPDDLIDIQVDPRVGGKWRFVLNTPSRALEYLEGDYLAVEPVTRLVFSWAHVVVEGSGRQERTPPSEVTVMFSPEGSATRLTVVHREIVSEGGRLGVRSGWMASFKTLSQVL